ncbi:MAG: LCP family protein [Candidatus Geothermincolia bacterium]
MTRREIKRRRRDLKSRRPLPDDVPARRPTKPKRYRFVILMVIVVALVCTVVFAGKPIAKLVGKAYLALKLDKSHIKGKEGADVEKSLTRLSTDPDKSVNTLVMGSDAGSSKGESGYCRSDVMLLVCLQERDKKAVVISIPRDTMVDVPGHGTQKINAAHAFDGPAGAIAAVKSLTGIDVHHYISMQFEGFEKIVDALGGIPIHLNKPINDPHSGYLPAGDLKLDGWQALVLVRSRNAENGDLDRIKSQHTFMKALMAKAETMKSVWKANQLVDIVASNCKLDYKAGQLMDLALELRNFKPENVQFVTVPGTDEYIKGVSYFVPNPTLIASMSKQVESDNWISAEQVAKMENDGVSRAEMLNAPDADAISVLSGTSSSSWAVPTVAQELKLMGHTKIFQGKTKEPLAQTTIYYRPEGRLNARAIIKAIPELKNANLFESTEVATAYNTPVVIVLGSKFTTPPIVALYGRICTPAFDFDNLGAPVESFKK